MKIEYIYSLRIGFTGAYADVISAKGINSYIQDLLNNPLKTGKPDFIISEADAFEQRKVKKQSSPEEKKAFQKEDRQRFQALQQWWINRIYQAENPLQEKMVLFWHNHFVSSYQKVKESSYIFYQNNLFRDYAFGNFKELTRQILYDNAMIRYLDNQQNKAGKPNENLSRELLELFTLGIGNYTETDVKEGARILAGLGEHVDRGQYNPKKADNGIKNYLGAKGNLKADDMVEVIFSHPKAANRITEKLLKYFLTDNPDEDLIKEYASFLKKNNYEIKPFLKKIFTTEKITNYNGSKIKDPLTFALQTFKEVSYPYVPIRPTLNFLKYQGMEILNPPNVKGWDGGRAWLDSGKLISRNTAINTIYNGKFIPDKNKMMQDDSNKNDFLEQDNNNYTCKVSFDKNDINNKEIIKDLSDRLLFDTDDVLQINMEKILKHDFDPSSPGAQEAITQLAIYIMKTPNYQLL